MTATSVFERLREKIVRNEVAPGERINIDAYVREFGVSQTPVREALRLLEGQGLVNRIGGRGYAATPLLDEAALRHMFEMRMLLEPWSVKVTSVDRAANPGEELLDQIQSFADEHAVACARIDLVGHDMQFHETIHRATGNDFLVKAYEGLHSQLHLFRLYGEDVDATETLEEHRRIAAAIARCSPAEAEAAMRDHLARALRRFLPLLRSSGGPDRPLPASSHVLSTLERV